MAPKTKNGDFPVLNLKKIFFLALSAYVLLIVSFYFLAGDQLHFRRSRGELTMPTAESGAVELTKDVLVEQTFQAEWVAQASNLSYLGC